MWQVVGEDKSEYNKVSLFSGLLELGQNDGNGVRYLSWTNGALQCLLLKKLKFENSQSKIVAWFF